MTAVEWMAERILKGYIVSIEQFEDLLEQAKEMEANVATEYAEFCIRCDRANLKQVKFEDWKKSWDETFKSE